MANLILHCNVCKKRAKRHENYAVCNLCSLPTHYQCLPIYQNEDNIYASNPNGHWSCPTCLENNFPFFSVENDYFSQQINITHTDLIHNIDSLNDMIIQPFDMNDMEEINDLDPDSNHFCPLINQNLTGCKYYNFDKLNQETSQINQNHFSHLCFNIRSLPKNHRKFMTLLETIETKFSVITLTETWLQEYNADLYEIEGYTHISQLRNNKAGGGLHFYKK
jgi:hypothetical protein